MTDAVLRFLKALYDPPASTKLEAVRPELRAVFGETVEPLIAELQADYAKAREDSRRGWDEANRLQAEFDAYKREHPAVPLSDLDMLDREENLRELRAMHREDQPSITNGDYD